MATKINLTQKQIQVIVGVALAVVGGGYFYFKLLLLPQMEAIKANTQKFQELKEQIATAEREARRLPALKDERERLNTELLRLEKQLPKDKDVPNIIRILTREALQESLEFIQFVPKPNQKNQFFEIVPFDLQMAGTLSNLARFFSSLGQHERIFKFQNVKLSPRSSDEGGLTMLSISFSVETYAYTGSY